MTGPRTQVFTFHGATDTKIVAEALRVVEGTSAKVHDVRSVITLGTRVLTLALESETPDQLRADLDALARGKGLSLSVEDAPRNERGRHAPSLCVTALGDVNRPGPIASLCSHIDAFGARVREMRSLGRPRLRGVELFIEMRDGSNFSEERREALRKDLLALAANHSIDLAVQNDDLFRKSKRLLCMDVDSTFVKGEFIDELAELAGVKPAVAEITARAMRGELDFKAALRERVKLLAGLPMERAMTLCNDYELSPGAEDLVCSAKRLGLKVGLVSGGFSFFVKILEKRYGLDFTFANELEIEGGRLTGNVLGTIVDAERKEQVLRDMAHVYGISLEQTIAAGDGANDISMLRAAGLGVAYQAKPKLKEVADAVLSHHDRLDSIFYFLGLDAEEVGRSCSP